MAELLEIKAKLLGSLLLFTKYFYKIRTGHEFNIAEPIGREPRQHTLSRAFTSLFHNPSTNLAINIHPGSGKSEMCVHFMAWALAHYPDCNFLYISHAKSLAERHTATLKDILSLSQYQTIFDVHLREDSKAKGHFSTTAGGTIMAFGSAGAVTGNDSGRPNLDRFSGCTVIDDIHNPYDVHSDVKRGTVKRNYYETIYPRKRGHNVGIIDIGQRLHEDDHASDIVNDKEGHEWTKIILPTVDRAGNNLSPDIISTKELQTMKKISPYVYYSQHQQEPHPAGGSLFKNEWFQFLPELPDIIGTFIVADTAETERTYNDATAFSFFGVYEIKQHDIPSGIYGLHWLDCEEIWIEPRDLETAFLNFYRQCMQFKVKPMVAAIERKSTGTTLCSSLKDYPGLKIMDIERHSGSGNKASRFLDIQPYVASKRVTFTYGVKHAQKCITHMSKITANDTHRYDDIADTLADGIKLGLIDNSVLLGHNSRKRSGNVVKILTEPSEFTQRPIHPPWLR